jgi:uncharacterized repeat protein (TIGR01451 family)
MHSIANHLLKASIAVLAVCAAADAALAKAPAVELSIKCPELRYVGREATFELTVTNKGDAAAHDVVVTDALPKGVEFRSADQAGKLEGATVVWRIGVLEAGQTRTLKTTLLCPTMGTFKNSARVAYCAEAVEDCTLEVKGIPAILLECVDDPDPIETGANVNYTITVTNQGSAVATNVVVNCTLPPELEYVGAKGATAATAAEQKITFAPLPSLAPNAKAVYVLTAKGVGEGDVRFQVEMKTDQIATSVMETEATHVYK